MHVYKQFAILVISLGMMLSCNTQSGNLDEAKLLHFKPMDTVSLGTSPKNAIQTLDVESQFFSDEPKIAQVGYQLHGNSDEDTYFLSFRLLRYPSTAEIQTRYELSFQNGIYPVPVKYINVANHFSYNKDNWQFIDVDYPKGVWYQSEPFFVDEKNYTAFILKDDISKQYRYPFAVETWSLNNIQSSIDAQLPEVLLLGSTENWTPSKIMKGLSEKEIALINSSHFQKALKLPTLLNSSLNLEKTSANLLFNRIKQNYLDFGTSFTANYNGKLRSDLFKEASLSDIQKNHFFLLVYTRASEFAIDILEGEYITVRKSQDQVGSYLSDAAIYFDTKDDKNHSMLQISRVVLSGKKGNLLFKIVNEDRISHVFFIDDYGELYLLNIKTTFNEYNSLTALIDDLFQDGTSNILNSDKFIFYPHKA